MVILAGLIGRIEGGGQCASRVFGGLGFRRQRIIRVADVIDDAGTTTGIVVHVAGNNTLFNQIVHIAPHGDNGQPDMAGNVITGMSLLGGVTEVAFDEGLLKALQADRLAAVS